VDSGSSVLGSHRYVATYGRLTVKETISKQDWLTAQRCLGMAWYGLRTGYEAPSEAELFRMLQGQEIGGLARQLYPSGILVSKTNGRSAAEVTQDLLTGTATPALFEATAQVGPFVAKADILTRDGLGWHVIEVKSSFSDTKSISELVDDLAYTVMIFRRAAVQISKASLALLSRTYRFGDSTEFLFDIVDRTDEVNERAQTFDEQADDVARVLFDQTQPVPNLVSACRDCPTYESECLASGLPHTVLEIPSLHHTKLKRLSQEGVVNISDLPTDLKLNLTQQRAVGAMLSGYAIVEPALSAALQKIEWPCHYLDFETVATVLPLYPTLGCHRQVVTQFSIHHRGSIDAEPSHSEYLASDPKKNCERELTEALIEKLGKRGSIIVYTNFEKRRIEALGDAFPDLADCLQSIVGRLLDLEKIIEDNVYHPEFRGSFSIKKVLPALVPELSYAELSIRDGDTAIARFARMAKGEISGDGVETTRRQLLTYCEMDTYAMLKLHEALSRLSARQPDAETL